MDARVVAYELRLLGISNLTPPVLVLLLFGCGALLSRLFGAEEVFVARLLVAGVELGLPFVAGVMAAFIVSEDPAVGLQLALRTGYRVTLARRLALVLFWISILAFVWVLALGLIGLWGLWVPGSLLAGQLVWLSPLLWFVAAGVVLALLTGSPTTSGAMLGGMWIFENMFRDGMLASIWLRPLFPFATVYAAGAEFWLANRLTLLVFALFLGMVAWRLSSMGEQFVVRGEA